MSIISELICETVEKETISVWRGPKKRGAYNYWFHTVYNRRNGALESVVRYAGDDFQGITEVWRGQGYTNIKVTEVKYVENRFIGKK